MMKVYIIPSQTESSTGLSSYAQALVKYSKNITSMGIYSIFPSRPWWISKLLFSLLGMDWKTLKKSYPIIWNLPKDGIIHFTNQQQGISLLFQRRLSVVTIHDIIPLTQYANYPFLRKLLFKLSMSGIKNVTFILADSEYTKKDIVNYLKISEEIIQVVPLGVDNTVFKPRAEVKKEPYTILYVGSEEPRKNILILVNAFALLKKKLPQAKLIKVGFPQWPDARERLVQRIKELGLENDVDFKGFVPNLAEEYNKAELFVFPSLYEGFGFPVLEAMSSGTPVICSNKTSLPEIGGKAVLYFDGFDENELAEKMHRVLIDENLKNHLQDAGLQRAKQFSWQRCVEKTVDVYNKLT